MKNKLSKSVGSSNFDYNVESSSNLNLENQEILNLEEVKDEESKKIFVLIFSHT